MAWKMKTGPKLALIAVSIIGVFYLAKAASNKGLLGSTMGKILAPAKYTLPSVEDAPPQFANVKPLPYPGTTCAVTSGTPVRGEHWEWNAQDALLLANGGTCTTEGSALAKLGVNLTLTRQDDTGKMGEDLVACAKEIHDGATSCSKGANFVVVMGDGIPSMAAALNPVLTKLGPDYGLKVIAGLGYSRGEDAFMAPSSLLHSPKLSETVMLDANGQELPVKGLLVEGVVRDGDWNIAEKWAGDNNIPNNPDETTFDTDAINWVNAPDYNQAAADYVLGTKCQDRREVTHGHPTGKTVHVCPNGVVTWTPGDVTVAEGRGGLVKIVSSEEYRSQMPAVIVGPAHFFNQHKEEMEAIIAGSFQEADQIKAYQAALVKASQIAGKIYGDEGGTEKIWDARSNSYKDGQPYTNGAYWLKYFHPVIENDKTGVKVSLGGSAVSNLADNKILFGIESPNDNYASTYSIFAAIDKQQYPNLFKDNGPTPLLPVKVVEDKSFILGAEGLLANTDSGTGAIADTVDYSTVGSSNVVAHRGYNVTFATGSATPTAEGVAVLQSIKDTLVVGGSVKIKIDGYTDNTGIAAKNLDLSEARAQAVRNWLQNQARGSFPANRFVSVEGHGSENPVGDNSSADGRAQNRRVDITQVN
jgi:OmpA-OmpF porin, OOP family